MVVERVLSDDGHAYRSRVWRQVCDQLGVTVKKTCTYRPQTNGKSERFHLTLADGWAYARCYARCYASETERRDALEGWRHYYHQHRPHTACGNQPPFSRLINVPGQYGQAAQESKHSLVDVVAQEIHAFISGDAAQGRLVGVPGLDGAAHAVEGLDGRLVTQDHDAVDPTQEVWVDGLGELPVEGAADGFDAGA
ncbi:hypothetical protein GCM10009599_26180 [Luteococcus peritonei]